MKRALATVLAVATACGHPGPLGKVSSKPSKPKLVVLIVIDQYPAWAFAQQKALFTGGIGRLLREGAIVEAAEVPYTSTFTAAGHAAIGTGAPPHVSGIVGNLWFRRPEGKDRPAEYDPGAVPFMIAPQMGDAAVSTDDGASSKALRVEGIADALRAGTGGKAKSIAISLKGRAACLMAGKRPDLAVWWEPSAGGMTTSSAYASDAPQWLVDLARKSPPSRFFRAEWDPLDQAALARTTKILDASPGESSKHGLDGAFPHSLADSDHPDHMIQQTPFADEIVAEAATVAIDAMGLGQDDVADLLAVSFSAHDYAGHAWGVDSWEAVDLTMRLDHLLGQLFETLDTKLGKDRWAAVLTSDHGGTRIVERGGVKDARRVPPKEIEAAAKTALEASAPGSPWSVHLVSSNLYITPSVTNLPDEQRAITLNAVEAAVAKVPGIGLAARTDVLSDDCTKEKDMLHAVCLGFVEGESGDLLVYPSPGSVISEETFGTGHDAASDDDRHVPILVMAPGLARAHGKGNLLQVAPTVTALLGVPAPPAAKEKPLFGL